MKKIAIIQELCDFSYFPWSLGCIATFYHREKVAPPKKKIFDGNKMAWYDLACSRPKIYKK